MLPLNPCLGLGRNSIESVKEMPREDYPSKEMEGMRDWFQRRFEGDLRTRRGNGTWAESFYSGAERYDS
jgi:hypothetical protein